MSITAEILKMFVWEGLQTLCWAMGVIESKRLRTTALDHWYNNNRVPTDMKKLETSGNFKPVILKPGKVMEIL